MPGKNRPSLAKYKEQRAAKRGFVETKPRGQTGNIYDPHTSKVTPGNGTLSSTERGHLYGVPTPGRGTISSARAMHRKTGKYKGGEKK